MGTWIVGEKGVWGEREDDLESNPAERFTVARERTSFTEHSPGGVMTEEVEDEEEAELDSCGGEG